MVPQEGNETSSMIRGPSCGQKTGVQPRGRPLKENELLAQFVRRWRFESTKSSSIQYSLLFSYHLQILRHCALKNK